MNHTQLCLKSRQMSRWASTKSSPVYMQRPAQRRPHTCANPSAMFLIIGCTTACRDAADLSPLMSASYALSAAPHPRESPPRTPLPCVDPAPVAARAAALLSWSDSCRRICALRSSRALQRQYINHQDDQRSSRVGKLAIKELSNVQSTSQGQRVDCLLWVTVKFCASDSISQR